MINGWGGAIGPLNYGVATILFGVTSIPILQENFIISEIRVIKSKLLLNTNCKYWTLFHGPL